jgi:uncharacterized membrane protein YeaQ/YmgE (transglycosylase-associated protein family)
MRDATARRSTSAGESRRRLRAQGVLDDAMSFIGYLIVLCLIGLVVGGLARLALPGKDPMSIWQTIAIGVGGSLLAGIVSAALFNRGAGFLLSVIFASGIVYLIRRSRGGGLTDPGAPPGLDR